MGADIVANPLLGVVFSTAVGAAIGGYTAWVAIRVDVALAKLTAERACESVKEAHVRIDDHIDRHHTK